MPGVELELVPAVPELSEVVTAVPQVTGVVPAVVPASVPGGRGESCPSIAAWGGEWGKLGGELGGLVLLPWVYNCIYIFLAGELLVLHSYPYP